MEHAAAVDTFEFACNPTHVRKCVDIDAHAYAHALISIRIIMRMHEHAL